MNPKYKRYIVVKPYINKRNGQMSIAVPKREFRKISPTIKFSPKLLVRLQIVRRKRG